MASGSSTFGSGKQAKDTLGYLILKIVMHSDAQNEFSKQIIEKGCSATPGVAHFLDLPDQKRFEWCQDISMSILGKPFESPSRFHPWQFSWKLDEVLKSILSHDEECRQKVIRAEARGSALRNAIFTSRTTSDRDLILEIWEKRGKNMDPAVLGLQGFTGHLESPRAIPLLIDLLDSTNEKSYLSAEALILLTGKSTEFLEKEILPLEVSRPAKIRLKRDYLLQMDLKKKWLEWWNSVKGNISWDASAKYPVSMDRPFHGKFSWKVAAKSSVTTFSHPGFIVTVEYPGGKETKTPISEIPTKQQFYFLKDGKEVGSAELADTAIPIVRVEVRRSSDLKKIIEINEIGPAGQSLRRTYGGVE